MTISAPSAPATGLFESRAAQTLAHLEATGQYKRLRTLEGPLGATVRVKGYGECLCFCSNNYLGLATPPAVVEAGSQALLLHLLAKAGMKAADIKQTPSAAMNETDLAHAIAGGKADAGIGIRSVAQQFKLGFVSLHTERFDLVMRRRDYFEAPVQKLLAFARGADFASRAAELGGYDIGGLGSVIVNA